MGSISSKVLDKNSTFTPERVYNFKRIEDPRSPTEEISRTPIEVADKASKNNEISQSLRENVLREKNQQYLADSSPRISREEWLTKEKSKYGFAAAVDAVSSEEDTKTTAAYNAKENDE